MAFKFVAVFALLAVANAGYLAGPQVYHAGPAAVVKSVAPVYAKAAEEYDPHPQYRYGYDVQDAVSGDSKSQVEERDGDVVRGEYSLIDADGYKRTVQYTADSINGFNAVVHRQPLVAKAVVAAPAVVKTVAPAYATYAAPTVVKSVAPAYTTYAAPAVVKSVAPAYTNYYAAPAVVKSVAPAYATYAAPAVVKSVAPAYTTYAAPGVVKSFAPAYTTYAAPAVTKTFAPAYSTYAAPYSTYAAPYTTYAAPANYVHHH